MKLYAPSEIIVFLKLVTLRRRCDPSDPANSLGAGRRCFYPSKARRLPELWWTTPTGGLVQFSEERISWSAQRDSVNGTWPSFSSPLLRRCFPSGLKLNHKPRRSRFNRIQLPPVECRNSFCVVVGPPFFRLWRERRHFWVLAETRLGVHSFQVRFIFTCFLEEASICSTVALLQWSAGSPLPSHRDVEAAVSSSSKGIGAAVFDGLTLKSAPQPALNEDYIGQRLAVDGASTMVKLAKLTSPRTRERTFCGARTDAIHEAADNPGFLEIRQVFRIDKCFVFSAGVSFGTDSMANEMVLRNFWFPRLAVFDYGAGLSLQPWIANREMRSLISTIEMDYPLDIFPLANCEVKSSGTREICFSFPTRSYPMDHGLLNFAEIGVIGSTWYSIARRFKWDPGGFFVSANLRLLSPTYRLTSFLFSSADQWPNFDQNAFLVLFGNNEFEGPDLGGHSVNSFFLHIWGTVDDALTRTNVFTMEACLWIELSGTTTVLYPGKRLGCSWSGYLLYRSGFLVLENTIHGFTDESVYLDVPVFPPFWSSWAFMWSSLDRCLLLLFVFCILVVRILSVFCQSVLEPKTCFKVLALHGLCLDAWLLCLSLKYVGPLDFQRRCMFLLN